MPSGPAFTYAVPLSLLEAAPPNLLFALLKPFQRKLGALGVPVDPSLYSESWLAELHSLLNSDDAKIPAALQSAFIHIGELGSELGHDVLVMEAIGRGVDLFQGRTIARQDLAFHAYLSHRDLFRAAHARCVSMQTAMFVEFCGRGSAAVPRDRGRPELAVLLHRLSTCFRARNRTDFCQVIVEERAEELVFLFRRGGAPQRLLCVHPAQRRESLTCVPERHDTVIYHKGSDALSICAPHPADRDLYRTVIGFVLALDEDYFRVWPLFSADPLRERGPAALDALDIPGLGRVSLRRITIVAPVDGVSTLKLASDDDLASMLDRDPVRWALHHGRIGAWTFGVSRVQNETPLEVHVRIPNQLRFDPRVPLLPLREFMVARGFRRLPTRR